MKNKIVDIQIRLSTKIDGVDLVTTWYGPKDKMRFAAIKYSPRELTQTEIDILEASAVDDFSERIKEMENYFSDILT